MRETVWNELRHGREGRAWAMAASSTECCIWMDFGEQGLSSSQPELLRSKRSLIRSTAHVALLFFIGSTCIKQLVNRLQLSDRSLTNVNACSAAQRWKTHCTQCSSLLIGSNETVGFFPLGWKGAHSGKMCWLPSWSQAAACCAPSWSWINAGVSSFPFTPVLAGWYCDRALPELS